MIIQDSKTLSLLINLAIASARLRSIEIQEEHAIHFLRPQIHILISGDPGSCKSTVLGEVAQTFKSHPYNDMTEAGLVGSIEKNMHMFIPGSAWSCRNSIMVIDEFEFVSENGKIHPIIDKLLTLTEHEQYFKKKIGLASNEIHEKDNDLFLNVKNGEIEVKTNFALMIGTMQHLRFRNTKLQALKTRAIPIFWKPDFDVILNISKGIKLFAYKDLLHNWKQGEKKVRISLEDYLIIRNYLTSKYQNSSLFLRLLGDMCRIFAILKHHDTSIYDLIIALKTGA